MTKKIILDLIDDDFTNLKKWSPVGTLTEDNTMDDVYNQQNITANNLNILLNPDFVFHKTNGSIFLDGTGEYYDLYSNNGIYVVSTLAIGPNSQLNVDGSSEIRSAGTVYLTNTTNPVISTSGICQLSNVKSLNVNTTFLIANTANVDSVLYLTNKNDDANVIVSSNGTVRFDKLETRLANTYNLKSVDVTVSNTLYLTDSDLTATPIYCDVNGTSYLKHLRSANSNVTSLLTATLMTDKKVTPNTSYSIDISGIINAGGFYLNGNSIYSLDQTYDSITFNKSGNNKGIFFANGTNNVGIVNTGTDLRIINKNNANASILTVNTASPYIVSVNGNIYLANTTPEINTSTNTVRFPKHVGINTAPSTHNLEVNGSLNANSVYISGNSVADKIYLTDVFISGKNTKETLVTGNVNLKTGTSGGLIYGEGIAVYEDGNELKIKDSTSTNVISINPVTQTITPTSKLNITNLDITGNLFFNGVQFTSQDKSVENLIVSQQILFPSNHPLGIAGVGAISSPSLVIKEYTSATSSTDNHVEVNENLLVRGSANVKSLTVTGDITGKIKQSLTIENNGDPSLIFHKTELSSKANLIFNGRELTFDKDLIVPNLFISNGSVNVTLDDKIAGKITELKTDGFNGTKLLLSSSPSSSINNKISANTEFTNPTITFTKDTVTGNISFDSTNLTFDKNLIVPNLFIGSESSKVTLDTKIESKITELKTDGFSGSKLLLLSSSSSSVPNKISANTESINPTITLMKDANEVNISFDSTKLTFDKDLIVPNLFISNGSVNVTLDDKIAGKIAELKTDGFNGTKLLLSSSPSSSVTNKISANTESTNPTITFTKDTVTGNISFDRDHIIFNKPIKSDGSTLTLSSDFVKINTANITTANIDTLLVNEISTFSQQSRIIDTTPSASPASGALVISGGIGVAKDSYFGDNLTVTKNITASGGNFSGDVKLTNATASTSSLTGALQVAGGIGVGENSYFLKNVTVDGTVKIANTTASTNSSTGALVVTGGIGVGGNSYFGGELHAVKLRSDSLIVPSSLTVSGSNVNIDLKSNDNKSSLNLYNTTNAGMRLLSNTSVNLITTFKTDSSTLPLTLSCGSSLLNLTENGNIGINTQNPTKPVHITGQVRVDGSYEGNFGSVFTTDHNYFTSTSTTNDTSFTISGNVNKKTKLTLLSLPHSSYISSESKSRLELWSHTVGDTTIGNTYISPIKSNFTIQITDGTVANSVNAIFIRSPSSDNYPYKSNTVYTESRDYAGGGYVGIHTTNPKYPLSVGDKAYFADTILGEFYGFPNTTTTYFQSVPLASSSTDIDPRQTILTVSPGYHSSNTDYGVSGINFLGKSVNWYDPKYSKDRYEHPRFELLCTTNNKGTATVPVFEPTNIIRSINSHLSFQQVGYSSTPTTTNPYPTHYTNAIVIKGYQGGLSSGKIPVRVGINVTEDNINTIEHELYVNGTIKSNNIITTDFTLNKLTANTILLNANSIITGAFATNEALYKRSHLRNSASQPTVFTITPGLGVTTDGSKSAEFLAVSQPTSGGESTEFCPNTIRCGSNANSSYLIGSSYFIDRAAAGTGISLINNQNDILKKLFVGQSAGDLNSWWNLNDTISLSPTNTDFRGIIFDCYNTSAANNGIFISNKLSIGKGTFDPYGAASSSYPTLQINGDINLTGGGKYYINGQLLTSTGSVKLGNSTIKVDDSTATTKVSGIEELGIIDKLILPRRTATNFVYQPSSTSEVSIGVVESSTDLKLVIKTSAKTYTIVLNQS